MNAKNAKALSKRCFVNYHNNYCDICLFLLLYMVLFILHNIVNAKKRKSVVKALFFHSIITNIL
jgi:hypothetical protein